MMLNALLLIAAAELGAFDDANLALTTCGFAAHRAANERNLTDGQFADKLSSDCSAQTAGMRLAVIALDKSRGKTEAKAIHDADRVIASFYSSFKDQYAHRAEDERKLRDLIQALEKEKPSDAR